MPPEKKVDHMVKNGVTDKPVRLAVIGVGALGRHHARILAEMEGVELIGVADPNQQQAENVAQQHQTVAVTDYRELLDRCDAVSIVAPTTLHHEIATECLSRGKDTLIEKPLTASPEQAQQLVELAKQYERIIQVGHIERFNPAFESLCETMTSVPRYIRAERLSPFAFRSMDIGVVHDLMIHDIELVLELTGAMPISVEALGAQLMGAHEDMAQARLVFPDGCVADITASRVNPQPKRCLSVWTSTELVHADLHTRELTCSRPTKELLQGPAMEQRIRSGEDVAVLREQVFGHFISIEKKEADQRDALTAELGDFVNCVKNRTSPRVDGTAGLRAVQVAELVLEAESENHINPRVEQSSQSRAA